MSTSPRALGAACALLACASAAGLGCARAAAPHLAFLHLVQPRLPPGESGVYQMGVYLNEELAFGFSAELERVSVTHESVRITDEDGQPARGRLEVDGAYIHFVPDLPLSSDLSDGGFRPGHEYQVELAGFPRPDGLRSTRGAPLAASVRASFTTVRDESEKGEPRTWLLFDERVPSRPGVLKLFPPLRGRPDEVYLATTQGAILLFSEKPIDPTTIHPDDFLLQRDGTSERIELAVRLVENQPRVAPRPRPANLQARSNAAEEWEQTARAAVLELVPRETPRPGRCTLSIRADANGQLTLRDFGNQPLFWPVNRPIGVEFRETRTDSVAGTFVEDFLRTPRGTLRSQAAVPGFASTSAWDDTGRVEVRYPAAAGDGSDGEVVLEATETRADVQATKLALPVGSHCALEVHGGATVLRAQTSLTIAGDLDCVGGAIAYDALREREPELCREVRHAGGRTLSSWLERARTDGPGWLVLIAGGDLTIEGSLHVEGPLLLCAGGMIRIPGQVRGAGDERSGQVWILGEGGGLDLVPRPNVIRDELVMDPPMTANPLRTPLELCVMSQALPQSGAVARYLGAEVRGSDASRNGSWRVHYLPMSALPLAPDFREHWVDSPALIAPDADGRCEPLIFFVEMRVGVGGRWDPPFVDAVQVTWEERARGGAR